MRRAIAGPVLLVLSEAAAGAPRLDSVAVQALGGKGADVVISVTIERPTLLDLSCSALIDTGDGGRIPISWNIGDSRTKTARYEYKRPGSYRVRVSGAGKDACVGLKEATVSFGASKADAKSTPPRCPTGWILVEESMQGGRFACRARPPLQPLRCPEGTTYFAEGGEIGCR